MNLLSIGKCSAPLVSCPMHEHPFWELIYQLEAPTTAVTAMGNYRVEPGELIIIPPNTPHRTVSDTPFRDACVKFERLDFPRTPTVVRDSDGIILGMYQLLFIMRDVRNETTDAILEKLSDAFHLAVKAASHANYEPLEVSRFKSLLRDNIENPYFDLTESVRELGYNPDYFRRCFKRYTSISPLRYLNGMRIERAKDLLRLESSLSVGEISARCGFRDCLYFSTAFKKEVGLSPLAYRQSFSDLK